MRLPRSHSFPVALVTTVASLLALAYPATAQESGNDCTSTSVGLTALTDLGPNTYRGEQGGLYPDGENEIPASHLDVGMTEASEVVPRNAAGDPDPDGRIGVVSIGVSNTRLEFRTFVDALATGDAPVNPAVSFINGAQGGRGTEAWSADHGQPWGVLEGVLDDEGITAAQVQVAWVKAPTVWQSADVVFPDAFRAQTEQLKTVLRELKDRYPNVRIAFLSSRIYGGYGSILSPEPLAYQDGFAVKWAIEAQIAGESGLEVGVDAPWLAWGPYMWSDGLGEDGVAGGVPGRADGLEWECTDLTQTDGIHPSRRGLVKVSGMLLDHFSSHPAARGWFLDGNAQTDPTTTSTISMPEPAEPSPTQPADPSVPPGSADGGTPVQSTTQSDESTDLSVWLLAAAGVLIAGSLGFWLGRSRSGSG